MPPVLVGEVVEGREPHQGVGVAEEDDGLGGRRRDVAVVARVDRILGEPVEAAIDEGRRLVRGGAGQARCEIGRDGLDPDRLGHVSLDLVRQTLCGGGSRVDGGSASRRFPARSCVESLRLAACPLPVSEGSAAVERKIGGDDGRAQDHGENRLRRGRASHEARWSGRSSKHRRHGGQRRGRGRTRPRCPTRSIGGRGCEGARINAGQCQRYQV